jgi:ABC-2 type transport system permease protein
VFFSGLTVPLVLFPGWFGVLARLLPWASYLQAPADLWLGKDQGWALLGVLALQAGWALVLLVCCRMLLGVAERKVVVQGG